MSKFGIFLRAGISLTILGAAGLGLMFLLKPYWPQIQGLWQNNRTDTRISGDPDIQADVIDNANLAQMKDMLRQTFDKNKQLAERIARFDEQRLELLERVEKRDQHIAVLEGEAADYVGLIKELTQGQKDYAHFMDILKAKIADSRENLVRARTLGGKLAQAEASLKQREEELAALKGEGDAYLDELTATRTELEKSKAELEEAREKVLELTRAEQEASGRIAELQQSADQASATEEEHLNKVKGLEGMLQDAKNTIADLETRLEKQKEAARKVAEDHQAASQRIQELESAGSNLSEKLKAEYESRVTELRSQLEDAAFRLDEVQAKASRLESENKQLAEEQAAARDKMQGLEASESASFTQLRQNYEARIQALQSEIEQLKTAEREARREVPEEASKAWEGQEASYREEIGRLETRIKELAEEKKMLAASLENNEASDQARDRGTHARLETARAEWLLQKVEYMRRISELEDQLVQVAAATDEEMPDNRTTGYPDTRDDMNEAMPVGANGGSPSSPNVIPALARRTAKPVRRPDESAALVGGETTPLTPPLSPEGRGRDEVRDEGDDNGEVEATESSEVDRSERSLVKENRRLNKEVEQLRRLRTKDKITFFYNLGLAYTYAGLFRDAEQMYLKVLEIDPKDTASHYNLGILYQDHLNKVELGLEHYREFLKYAEDGEKIRRVRNWIRMAGHEWGSGRQTRQEAVEDAVDSLFFSPAS